jgi:hypothetical protein
MLAQYDSPTAILGSDKTATSGMVMAFVERAGD